MLEIDAKGKAKSRLTPDMQAAGEVDKVIDDLTNPQTAPKRIKTGFEFWDKPKGNFYGGMPPSLIFLAGETGAGKTTYLMQLAEQVAGNGTKVLYFSLEMSKRALLSKTYARLTDINAGRIMNGNFDDSTNSLFKVSQMRLMEIAAKAVKKRTQNIRIYTSNEQGERLTAEDIYRITNAEYRNTLDSIFVIIDYLQIIETPQGTSGTDKQIINDKINWLVKMRNEMQLPVMCVSSLNRSTYKAYKGEKEDIQLASLKESGEIEYYADIVLALKYGDITQQKQGYTPLRMVTLKNRYNSVLADNFTICWKNQTICENLTKDEYKKLEQLRKDVKDAAAKNGDGCDV